MSRVQDRPAPTVVFDVRGHVPEEIRELAREKVAGALRYAPEPVLFVRVKLSVAPDPAVADPAVAQANVDVNGRVVRVQAAAPTLRNAVHLLPDLLLERFERISRHWEAVRGRHPRPVHRPAPRRAGADREVVRHKTFALTTQTVDETAFDMEAMGYDFHLFTDAGSGQDSVLYRIGTGFRLASLDLVPDGREPGAVPVEVSPRAAVRATVAEAIERLEALGLPFVFFADAETGRGNVLYHRYDGHYGLITPAEEAR